MAIDPQNLSGTASLTFGDDFNSLNLRTGGSGIWSTKFWYSPANGSTLDGNGEQEWYINAEYAPTQSVKPWTVNNGVLDITAQNASPDIQQQINGYKYTSGVLTTHDTFSQTYGYFEIRAQLPQGNGLWPAFWLLPADGSWPPEIDVMEQLGHDPNKYYATEHSIASGSHTSQGSGISTPDLTTGFHTYGVDWESDKLTYFFDGKQVFQTDTPADMHKPMYMLVNLAVGGYWPGDPTPDPNYSETLHVDYIHAYSAKPDGAATGPSVDVQHASVTDAAAQNATAVSVVEQAASASAAATLAASTTAEAAPSLPSADQGVVAPPEQAHASSGDTPVVASADAPAPSVTDEASVEQQPVQVVEHVQAPAAEPPPVQQTQEQAPALAEATIPSPAEQVTSGGSPETSTDTAQSAAIAQVEAAPAPAQEASISAAVAQVDSPAAPDQFDFSALSSSGMSVPAESASAVLPDDVQSEAAAPAAAPVVADHGRHDTGHHDFGFDHHWMHHANHHCGHHHWSV